MLIKSQINTSVLFGVDPSYPSRGNTAVLSVEGMNSTWYSVSKELYVPRNVRHLTGARGSDDKHVTCGLLSDGLEISTTSKFVDIESVGTAINRWEDGKVLK